MDQIYGVCVGVDDLLKTSSATSEVEMVSKVFRGGRVGESWAGLSVSVIILEGGLD